REALRLAREQNDTVSVMWALDELGFVLAGAADYRASVPLLEEALDLAERLGEREAQVEILSRSSIVQTNQVRFDRAAAFGERALTLARALAREPTLAIAIDAQKQVAVELGDLATVQETTRWMEASCRRRGDLWRLQFVVFES